MQKPTFLEGVRIQLKCKSCLCTRIKQYVYGENSTSEQTENAIPLREKCITNNLWIDLNIFAVKIWLKTSRYVYTAWNLELHLYSTDFGLNGWISALWYTKLSIRGGRGGLFWCKATTATTKQSKGLNNGQTIHLQPCNFGKRLISGAYTCGLLLFRDP